MCDQSVATSVTSALKSWPFQYTVWRKAMDSEWECMECGYLHEGGKPPRRCPDCGTAEAWEKVEYVDDWDDEDLDEEHGKSDELDDEE
jgi:rubredoxin